MGMTFIMFLRSMMQKVEDNTGDFAGVEPNIQCLLGGEPVTVKSTATNSPSRLGLRIAEGDDVIGVWFGWEHQGVSIPKKTGVYDLLPIEKLSKEDIFGFCQAIQVHPAHLVPLKPQPEFSLPAPLLELLIDMSRGRVSGSAEDINLAKVAVAMEVKRINSFLARKSGAEPLESATPDTLTKVFSTVLGNPILMGRLVKEFSVVHESMATQYPMAMRVRNVAYTVLRDRQTELGQSQRRQEKHLDSLLKDIEAEYKNIFSGDIVSNEILFFIGDIKDELAAKSIESAEATPDDILTILKKADLTGSPFEQSHHYYNAVFGSPFDLRLSAHDFLADLSETIYHYFNAEDKLATFRHKYALQMDAAPLIEDVKGLFEDKSFQEGTLFRRLMDNRVILALAHHQNKPRPIVEPK